MRDERTTVSPFSILACLWLSTAARDRADMGSPWVPLIMTQTLFGSVVLHLAGLNQQAFGNVDVAEVLGDLGGVHHRTSDEAHFAAVLAGDIDGELDAVNRRREAGDEQDAAACAKRLRQTCGGRCVRSGV